ncbi:MAG: hypothetical protein ACXU86_05430 [Archangium sp.]
MRTSVEIYDPATGTWSTRAPFSFSNIYPTAILLSNGRVLLGGAGNHAEQYDVSTNTWTTLPQLVRDHTEGKLALVNGQPVMVAGIYWEQSIEQFDSAHQQWSIVGQISVQRYDFTVNVLADGSALTVGGQQVNTYVPYATMDLFTLYGPPPSSFTYSANKTNSAQQNTVNRIFTLNAGDLLEVGTCNLPGATATGNTYLRLFGATGTQLAENDIYCDGVGSFIQYTAPTSGTYELRAGCSAYEACSGTMVFRVTSTTM